MSVAELEAREVQLEAPTGLWRDAWGRLRRNPGALVGLGLVSVFIVVGRVAPPIAPHHPRAPHHARHPGTSCPGPAART